MTHTLINSSLKTLSPGRLANKELNHKERAEGRLIINSRPLVAKLEVTTLCNLRCTMCSISYSKPKGGFLDFNLFMKLEPLFPYLIATYLYGVGEPLLHPRLMDMFTVLSEAGVRVGFITNGMLITEKKIHEWLSKGLYKLSLSIDGATPETYNAIRRRSNFHRVMRNMKALDEIKKSYGSPWPRVTFNFIGMKQNIHELPKLIELAHVHGADEVIVTELIAFVDEMKKQVLAYNDPMLTRYYAEAEKVASELNIRLVLPNTYLRWRQSRASVERIKRDESLCASPHPINNTLQVEKSSKMEIPFADCTEPWSGFWLTRDGFVTPCCYWFKGLGDLTKHSFDEIWNNEEYQYLRKSVNDPVLRDKQCRNCPVPQ